MNFQKAIHEKRELRVPMKFSRASLLAQMVKNLPAMKRPRFDPWVGKIARRRQCLYCLQYSCLENSRQRSLWGYSLRVSDSDMP